MANINWGSAPDWLAGVGAVTALLFARRAVKAAHATNEQQNKQLKQLEAADRRREGDERQRQASQFAVWLELDDDHLQVRFSNASSQPVHRLMITSHAGKDRGVQLGTIPIVPPTSEPSTLHQASRDLTDLFHNLTTELRYFEDSDGNQIISDHWRRQIAEIMDRAIEKGIDIHFMDSSGNWWHRSAFGQLREVDGIIIPSEHRELFPNLEDRGGEGSGSRSQ